MGSIFYRITQKREIKTNISLLTITIEQGLNRLINVENNYSYQPPLTPIRCSVIQRVMTFYPYNSFFFGLSFAFCVISSDQFSGLSRETMACTTALKQHFDVESLTFCRIF